MMNDKNTIFLTLSLTLPY